MGLKDLYDAHLPVMPVDIVQYENILGCIFSECRAGNNVISLEEHHLDVTRGSDGSLRAVECCDDPFERARMGYVEFSRDDS